MRQEITQRLEELRAARGEMIPLDEIGEIVDGIMNSLNGDITGGDIKMYHQVQELASYIESAKSEIIAIRPQDISEEHIQVATDELDAIVSHTEEATGAILDAAEKLEALANRVDDDVANKIRQAVTAIYEASNFQDITGQRITRVVRALKDIDEKVAAIVDTVMGDRSDKAPRRAEKNEKKAASPNGKPSDADLLNGPQLPDAAKNQHDIDALFASPK